MNTKLTWKKDPKGTATGAFHYFNDFYVIEKRHGLYRVFDRLGRRVVSKTELTLRTAKRAAQLDLDATNLNEH